MAWSPLHFKKHKGQSLPQVLFSNPGWFFWAIEKKIFRGKLAEEANELNRKARSIKIPQTGTEKFVAEYIIHPTTNKFERMQIVKETTPGHVGSTKTLRKNVIDLSVPRSISPQDELGDKLIIKSIKICLFKDAKYRFTKTKCEDFFSDDKNFDLIDH